MNSVELESVSKVYPVQPGIWGWFGREREIRALDGVSLRAAAGSVLVLLGPNGSGKTTALKLISTMLLPDRGNVIVHGVNTRSDSAAVRRKVGFAIANERSFFPRLTARENLTFFATLEDVPRAMRKERVEEVLEEVDLVESADVLAMKFSSGMFQRLGVARALLKQPATLLLDEPTRSQDPAAGAKFDRFIRELKSRGTTVVVATHSFQEAVTTGDEVAVLLRGRVIAHRALEKETSIEELRAFYFEKTSEAVNGFTKGNEQ